MVVKLLCHWPYGVLFVTKDGHRIINRMKHLRSLKWHYSLSPYLYTMTSPSQCFNMSLWCWRSTKKLHRYLYVKFFLKLSLLINLYYTFLMKLEKFQEWLLVVNRGGVSQSSASTSGHTQACAHETVR